VDVGGIEVNPMLTVILPVGVIFFGVFLISLILEKEIATFDEEQRQRLAFAHRYSTAAKEKKIYENETVQTARQCRR
jgi:hypothetical protein